MKRYLLEFTVFITGALVMVLELVGSRVVAPYLGTSLIVWTSLIGVVLASLSLGYYWGGRLADKNPHQHFLGLVITLAGIATAIVAAIHHPFLSAVQDSDLDLRIQTLLATITLFVVPSTLLGMVSPYAAKLRLSHLQKSGRTVGNLYALSTLGSIVGTFLTGFVLVTWLGTTKILIVVAVLLVLTGLLVLIPAWKKAVVGLVLVIFLSSLTLFAQQNRADAFSLVDVDTQYNRVWIYPTTTGRDRLPVLQMSIGNEFSSAMSLTNDDLAYSYTKRYRLARHFMPTLENTLMIGGAGYSYPRDFLKQYSSARMDVVEIDPALTTLAKQYFRLQDDPRLSIIHEDGRTYLNTTEEKYDVIYGDAFKSIYSIPYQLTTKEAVQEMCNTLTEKGVLMVNVITALEGEASTFLHAEYATLKSVFPQVYIFPVGEVDDPEDIYNVMVVALKSPDAPAWTSAEPELQSYLNERWEPNHSSGRILTDEFAPVDFYMLRALLR